MEPTKKENAVPVISDEDVLFLTEGKPFEISCPRAKELFNSPQQCINYALENGLKWCIALNCPCKFRLCPSCYNTGEIQKMGLKGPVFCAPRKKQCHGHEFLYGENGHRTKTERERELSEFENAKHKFLDEFEFQQLVKAEEAREKEEKSRAEKEELIRQELEKREREKERERVDREELHRLDLELKGDVEKAEQGWVRDGNKESSDFDDVDDLEDPKVSIDEILMFGECKDGGESKEVVSRIRSKGQGTLISVKPFKVPSSKFKFVLEDECGAYFVACKRARLQIVRVLIDEQNPFDVALFVDLQEMLNREDVSPIEKAKKLEVIRAEFQLSVAMLTDVLGAGQTVTHHHLLLALHEGVQQLVHERKINVTLAVKVGAIKEKEAQFKVAEAIVKHNIGYSIAEQLIFSVNSGKSLEEEIAKAAERCKLGSTRRPDSKVPGLAALPPRQPVEIPGAIKRQPQLEMPAPIKTVEPKPAAAQKPPVVSPQMPAVPVAGPERLAAKEKVSEVQAAPPEKEHTDPIVEIVERPGEDSIIVMHPKSDSAGTVTYQYVPEEDKITEVFWADWDKIIVLKEQPREYFDPARMAELAESIKAIGQRTPVPVKPYHDPEGRYQWQLVDGERRYRACKMAGVSRMKVYVEDVRDDKQHFLFSVIANFSHEAHTPLEIARAIRRIKEEHGYNDDRISKIFGKSRSWVQQYLSLLILDKEIQDMMRPEVPKEKQISFAIGMYLASVRDPKVQVLLAKEIVTERLNTIQANAHIRRRVRELNAPAIKRERSPKNDFRMLENLIVRIGMGVDNFLQMGEADFKAMFKYRLQDGHPSVLANLNDVSEKLEKLKKRVAESK